MTTEEPPKEDWLKMLCRHVANTICKADAVSALEIYCWLEVFLSFWLEAHEAKELVNSGHGWGELEQKISASTSASEWLKGGKGNSLEVSFFGC